MNLENLISKYLDGELSINEDRQLRELISTDPEAKEAFEDTIEIHYMLKQDAASMMVPHDVSNETEDKILMRILSDIPSFDEVISGKKSLDLSKMIAPVIGVFLLIGIYSIGEFNLGNPSFTLNEFNIEDLSQQLSANSIPTVTQNDQFNNELVREDIVNESFSQLIDQEVETNEPQVITIAKNEDLISNELDQLDVSRVSDDILDDQENYLEEDDIEEESVAPTIRARNTNVLTNEFNTLNTGAFLNTSSIDRTGASGMPVMNMSYEGGFEIDNLEMTSFASSDMFRSGIDPAVQTLVSSISQSVSYELSEKTFAGLEFGFTEYTLAKTSSVIIPYNQLDDFPSDILGERTKNGLRTSVTYQQNKQMYWASFYYGKNLIDYNRFSLDSRVGFGASNYGPMGFGKLLMNIRLFNGVDLTAGLDGRIFKWDLSTYDDHNMGMRSSLSFIYGLNIRL